MLKKLRTIPTKRLLFVFYISIMLATSVALEVITIDTQSWDWRDGICPSLVTAMILFVLYTILSIFSDRHEQSLATTLAAGYLFFQFNNFHLAYTAEKALLLHLLLLGSVILFLQCFPQWAKQFLKFFLIYIHLYFAFTVWVYIEKDFGEAYNLKTVFTAKKNNDKKFEPKSPKPSTELPDIYYIVPDAYANNETLLRRFHYDNSGFSEALRERGFHVQEHPLTNYIQTMLSLGSTLNLDYLQHDLRIDDDRLDDKRPLIKHITDSRLEKILRASGYDIVDASSGFQLEKPGNLRLKKRLLHPHFGLRAVNSLLSNTPILEGLNYIFGSKHTPLDLYAGHREMIESSIAKLEDEPRKESRKPRFVFMHLMLPHTPFVYDAEGKPLDTGHQPFYLTDGSKNVFGHEYKGGWDKYYLKFYPQQLQYANKRILGAVDSILKHAKRPPIILIQSDHGSRSSWNYWVGADQVDLNELFLIYSAYYFPDGDYSAFKESPVSPVNSFRLILGKFLGLDTPLLEDHFYYSKWRTPYHFEEIERLPNAQ